MIELVDGFWLNPDSVTVVKEISDEKCAIWVTGQSAMEGFVLEASAEDVIAVLHGESDEDDDENPTDDEYEINLDNEDEE